MMTSDYVLLRIIEYVLSSRTSYLGLSCRTERTGLIQQFDGLTIQQTKYQR